MNELGIRLNDAPEKDAVARRLLGVNRLNSMQDTFGAMGVVNSKYHRGVTPLSLSLQPGNYIVYLEVPSEVHITGDLIKWLENDSIHGPAIMGLISGHNGAAYLVEIIDGEPNHLTQIWQPKNATLSGIEAIYPVKEVFPVDEREITPKLSDAIPPNDITTIIRLLRKGGKVVYRKGNKRTILEVDAQGKLTTIVTYQDD